MQDLDASRPRECGRFATAGMRTLVIASVAKQSSFLPSFARSKLDCFVAMAPRNDGRGRLKFEHDRATFSTVIARHRVSPSTSPMNAPAGDPSIPETLQWIERPRRTGSPGQAGRRQLWLLWAPIVARAPRNDGIGCLKSKSNTSASPSSRRSR
jgi:hypothetical protein